MFWLIGAGVLIALVIVVGGQMNRQAAARGPRRGTNHLSKIRDRARRREGRR